MFQLTETRTSSVCMCVLVCWWQTLFRSVWQNFSSRTFHSTSILPNNSHPLPLVDKLALFYMHVQIFYRFFLIMVSLEWFFWGASLSFCKKTIHLQWRCTYHLIKAFLCFALGESQSLLFTTPGWRCSDPAASRERSMPRLDSRKKGLNEDKASFILYFYSM